jgi:hypothetical protein
MYSMRHLLLLLFLACLGNTLIAQNQTAHPQTSGVKNVGNPDSAKAILNPGALDIPEMLYEKEDGTIGTKKADSSRTALFLSLRHAIPPHTVTNKSADTTKRTSGKILNSHSRLQPELLKDTGN